MQELNKCTTGLIGRECLQQIKLELDKIKSRHIVMVLNADHAMLNADPTLVIKDLQSSEELSINKNVVAHGLNIIGDHKKLQESVQVSLSSPEMELLKTIKARVDFEKTCFSPVDWKDEVTALHDFSGTNHVQITYDFNAPPMVLLHGTQDDRYDHFMNLIMEEEQVATNNFSEEFPDIFVCLVVSKEPVFLENFFYHLYRQAPKEKLHLNILLQNGEKIDLVREQIKDQKYG